MSTPLRLLVTGCGGIAGAWLNPLAKRTDAVVVGLCDLDPKRAEARRSEFSLPAEVGSDLAAMIDRVHPDIVVDLTIPDAHADVACLALGKGCHVLAEKPLAATMDHARRILAAARQSGRVHAVMQNRRYLPQMLRFRDAIRGRVGRLAELHADFFIGAHFGGFRDEMQHVLILDMAIHTFDQARFLTGQDPVAVNAVEWNPAGSWYRHGASALVAVEMADGTRFTYRGSWCSEGANTSWEAQWRAIGTGGTVRWNGGDAVQIDAVQPWKQGQFTSTAIPTEDAPAAGEMLLQGHAGCIDEMLTAIAAGRKPQTWGEDNVKSLAIVHAAIQSARNGGARVAIKDLA
jgi:predicted dehydrogenase